MTNVGVALLLVGPLTVIGAALNGLDLKTVRRFARASNAHDLISSAWAAPVIPPIMGGPEYDLVLLVHSADPLQADLVARTRESGFPESVHALTARNSGLFGDTEGKDGEILLNHFVGSASSQAAVEAWKSVSWYADRLGVDNSTLLEFTGDSS